MSGFMNSWGIPDITPFNPVSGGIMGMGQPSDLGSNFTNANMPSMAQTPSFNLPGVGGAKAGGLGLGGATTFDKLGIGLAGIGTLANIFAAFQAQKLAKQQFEHTKNFGIRNFDNQVDLLNQRTADIGRNRAQVEGWEKGKEEEFTTARALRRYGQG